MKKMITQTILATTLLFSSVAMSEEPATKESIKALLQLTGAGQMGVQAMNQMLPELKKMAPDAPESFWVDFMNGVDGDVLENMVIPIYQKHLTESDIQVLNEFYQSDAGKKFISVQPLIMQESMQVGQQWGQNLAREVIQKYEDQKKK